jgi:hypothetical protein
MISRYRATEAPQLRVIDDATWNAAQAIKLKRSHLGAPHAASAFGVAAV